MPGGKQADYSGEDEGDQVIAEVGAHRPCESGGQGRAHLMAREDPAEHDADVVAAKGFGGQTHRGGNGGDPVQAVEQGEGREPPLRPGKGVRQTEERQASQAIIATQQITAVITVGQPTGEGGAEEVEDAHHR